MKITVKTGSYNQRRYGKPWIAVVDFSHSAKGEYSWGDWVGDHNKGSEGLLVIEAALEPWLSSRQSDFLPWQPPTNFYYEGELRRYLQSLS